MQVGQTLVLHLQQFLQVCDVLLKQSHAIVGFLECLVLRHGVFAATHTRLRGLRTAGLGPRDLQPVLVFVLGPGLVLDLGRHAATGHLACFAILGWRPFGHRRQFVAVSVPVRRLLGHDLLGLAGRDSLDFALLGNGQNPPRAQTVHVAAIEGVAIGAQQADKHLLETDPFGLGLVRNLAQGFAALHLMQPGVLSLRRCGRRGGLGTRRRARRRLHGFGSTGATGLPGAGTHPIVDGGRRSHTGWFDTPETRLGRGRLGLRRG